MSLINYKTSNGEKKSGAAGSRTLVQTRNQNVFYMLSPFKFFRETTKKEQSIVSLFS